MLMEKKILVRQNHVCLCGGERVHSQILERAGNNFGKRDCANYVTHDAAQHIRFTTANILAPWLVRFHEIQSGRE
jgi:hypothetical protein